MVKFYDPKDEADQARVENLLHQAAIEYFLGPETAGGACREIEVAEEDVPKAEEVLLRGGS
jgi:hypothetical protein